MPAIQPTWSDRSKTKLLELKSQNKSWPEISRILKRSESACQAMYYRLCNPATKRRGRPRTVPPSQELRDWFAGMALTGLCGNPAYESLGHDRLSFAAYSIADAMIVERDHRNEEKG